MLQLVLGQSGSGKSFKMREMLCNCDNENIIFLVPEQGSFDAEKTIYRFLPPKVRQNVEVLTFSRLCNNIFRTYGGLAGDRINDSGKCMVMSVALDALKDELKVYRNYYRRPEFIKRMTAAADEFKNAGLSAERLNEICEGQTGTKVEKLRELGRIYSLYSSVLEKQGLDSRDDIKRATRLAIENGFFVGKTVFVDGFKDFTGVQTELVKLMLSQCRELIVALCIDSLDSKAVMFMSPKNTAKMLKKTANELGVEVKSPIILDGSKRAKNALGAVAENFLRHDIIPYEEDCDDVTIYCAKNPRDEAEFIAASISDLVKKQGYRYKDIVVVGRSEEEYSSILRDSFLRYDIPVFNDNRDDISTKPLVKLITALITAARNKADTDSIFAMLKSPFSPFEYEKVCEFENYGYIWNLTGYDLRSPLKNHPKGLGKKFSDKDQEILACFEQIRNTVVTLIDSFADKTENCDGEEFAKEIYTFLCKFGVEQKTTEKDVEVYNCVIACLEQMAIVLKGMYFGIERMEAFLKTALSESDYGKIPEHYDEVTIGTANRIRYSSPKAVFLYGAVDSKFPSLIKNDAIIGWDEREFLRQNNVTIPDNEKEMYADERYFAYMAVSAPSEKLFVCYSSAGMSGETFYKSLIVSQIEKIVPKVKRLTSDSVDRTLFLQTRKGILREYSERFFEDDALCEAIRNTDDGTVAELEEKAQGGSFAITDPKLSSALFGNNIKLSASQVESFYKCHFTYFCEKGLRVYPLRKIEMDPMQRGNFIHYCLYALLSQRTKDEFVALNEKEITRICDKLAEEYLSQELVATDFSDKRFLTLMMKMKSTVKRIATRLQEEFRDSDFVPVEFEADIDFNSEIKPLIRTLADGSVVRIEGKVDRIDLLEKDGKRYIRIVDYKTGAKKFNADDIDYGLNLQMLLYLFAVCDKDSGKYAGAEPAGILYMPSGDTYYEATDDPEGLEKQRDSMYRMSGVVLDDTTIIEAMEKGKKAKFIPVRFKNDGTLYASSPVLSAEEFSEIKGKIEKVLYSMGNHLRKGQVSPMPTEANGYNACQYCNFANVCKRAGLPEEDGKEE